MTTLITVLTVLLLGTPLAVEAQQAGKVHRIGVVWLLDARASAPFFEPFRRGMADRGWVEGRNVRFEQRWAEGDTGRYSSFFEELVRMPVDMFVLFANSHIAAAKRVTATIPIVMVHSVDPVAAGFAASLARPGGNITGTTIDVSPTLIGKVLEVLHEAAPRVRRIGLLYDRTHPGLTGFLDASETGAHRLGLTLQSLGITRRTEVRPALDSLVSGPPAALVVLGGPLVGGIQPQLDEWFTTRRIPIAVTVKEYLCAACLMAYGPSFAEGGARAAAFVDKILRGAKPADLPVEQPTKFELVINLKTAKALGLTLLPSLLLRADQVIE